MFVHILIEPEYASSTWCDQIVNGLTTEAKNKKIEYAFQTDEFSSSSEDMIALIGNSSAWIQHTANQIQHKHASHIILISNAPYPNFITNICTNFCQSMLDILLYLKNDCGKKNIALYGINESSYTDLHKLKGFNQSKHVYYNRGDLRACFHEFHKNIDLYDAVICANDYAAISLLQNLKQLAPEQIERLFLISFSDLHVSKKYKPSITTVSLNYYEYGRAAISLYRLLVKNPQISFASLNVKSVIIPRETTRNIPYRDLNRTEEKLYLTDMDFYKDPEIRDLILLEKLFTTMSDVDLRIIDQLSNGFSYEQIANAIGFSVNGIKYRLNKLMDACNIGNRKELLKIYRKYLSE